MEKQMDITKEMITYWLGDDSEIKIINYFRDIANRKISISILRQDIIESWNARTIGVES